MEKKFSFFDLLVTISMLFVFIITLYPILYIFSISFSDTQYISQGKVLFYPKGFTFAAYKLIFETPKIPNAYLHSILYTVVGVSCNLLMTIITAYPLSKKHMMFRKSIMLIIVITMFFNGGMIPTFILVSNLGLIDSMWSLIIPNVIWTFELLVLKSFFEAIPEELYESARIDGANEFTILFRIFVPLSSASIAALGLFYIMGHWNSYFLPSIYLNDANKYPLQVVLKNMLISEQTASPSDVLKHTNVSLEASKNATIFITILPMIILYPFLQKYFVKGVMLGAVKG